jgi:hypothetical protein
MKNKKLLYILIPGTLVVWGVIVYKILAGVGDNDRNTVQKLVISEIPKKQIMDDTFSIHPTYRDPFSGFKEVKRVEIGVSQNQPKKVQPLVPIVTKVEWPDIRYGGMVKNQQKQLIIIQVNGQSTILKIGELFQGVELNKVYKDSIEVKFGNLRKWIKS